MDEARVDRVALLHAQLGKKTRKALLRNTF